MCSNVVNDIDLSATVGRYSLTSSGKMFPFDIYTFPFFSSIFSKYREWSSRTTRSLGAAVRLFDSIKYVVIAIQDYSKQA